MMIRKKLTHFPSYNNLNKTSRLKTKMQEYYFLFALALIWTIFATVQDIRKREVANWLNFSLILFALTFRAFYAITKQDLQFFILGLLGFALFYGLAHAFYYGKIFAGGDAKLLMGFGIILPYTSYLSLITLALTFIFLLLATGAIYSLFYSIFLVAKNKKKFKSEFKKLFSKNRTILIASLIIFLLSLIYGLVNPIGFIFSPLLLIPILFIYTKSLDRCMLVLLPPNKLTEGDWIEHDIKLSRGKIIRKTVHGLSKEEIKLIKKYKKSVLIKQGIPFVPAFLISLIILIIASQTLLNLFF